MTQESEHLINNEQENTIKQFLNRASDLGFNISDQELDAINKLNCSSEEYSDINLLREIRDVLSSVTNKIQSLIDYKILDSNDFSKYLNQYVEIEDPVFMTYIHVENISRLYRGMRLCGKTFEIDRETNELNICPDDDFIDIDVIHSKTPQTLKIITKDEFFDILDKGYNIAKNSFLQ